MTAGIGATVATASALVATTWLVGVASAQADPMCNSGGPPDGAATRPFAGGVVWVSGNGLVGVTTTEGTGSLRVDTDSPMPIQALVVDARNDGQNQLIVSDGRVAYLYFLEGCRINPVFDGQGNPFIFGPQNLPGNGTGVGCEDLGAGRRLVTLQSLPGGDGFTVRRTEININGNTGTSGRSDTVAGTASAALTITCGDQTMAKDGVQQP